MRKFFVDPIKISGLRIKDFDYSTGALTVANALYFYCEWDKEWKKERREAFNFNTSTSRSVYMTLERKLARVDFETNGLCRVIIFEDFPEGKDISGFERYLREYLCDRYVKN